MLLELIEQSVLSLTSGGSIRSAAHSLPGQSTRVSERGYDLPSLTFIYTIFFFQAEDGIRDADVDWSSDVCSSDLEQLLSSDARLAVRINKEFKTNVLSNQNEGKPMFSWDVIPYDEVLSVGDVEIKQSDVKIYPNPATNQLNIVWDEIDVKEIKITSFQGKTVKSLSANGVKGDLKIDINDLSPGIYFVNVGNTVHKLIVK